MATVFKTLSVIGAVTSAAGSVLGGIQQQRAAEANAEMARQQSAAARAAGEIEAQRRLIAGQKLLSQQQAAYSASGVTYWGSPLAVMEDTAQQIARDALMAKYNYMLQSSQAQAQANIYETYGQQMLWRGISEGAGSLLTAPVKYRWITDTSTSALGQTK